MSRLLRVEYALILFMLSGVGRLCADPSPTIRHEPVKVAEQGQDITLLARVTADPGPIESVTLHYTLSRHSAPIKIPMVKTGMDIHSATIPADYFKRSNVIYYYIEAEAVGGYWAETTWQAVPVKRVGEVVEEPMPPGAVGQPVKVMPSQHTAEASSGMTSGQKTALVAGGIGVAALAAVALSDDGGGGGGGSPSSSTTTTNTTEILTGTYAGSSTVCLKPDDADQVECNPPGSATITIAEDGTASSPDLAAGSSATGVLNGNTLFMTAASSSLIPGSSGDAVFTGTVRDGRIIGDVSGRADGGEREGAFTGNFSLTRQ